jgi:hypothetical protein
MISIPLLTSWYSENPTPPTDLGMFRFMVILTWCFTMAKALGWVTSQNAWGGAGLLLHTRLLIFRMPHPWDSPYTFNFLSEASQEAIFNSDLKRWGKKIQGKSG